MTPMNLCIYVLLIVFSDLQLTSSQDVNSVKSQQTPVSKKMSSSSSTSDAMQLVVNKDHEVVQKNSKKFIPPKDMFHTSSTPAPEVDFNPPEANVNLEIVDVPGEDIPAVPDESIPDITGENNHDVPDEGIPDVPDQDIPDIPHAVKPLVHKCCAINEVFSHHHMSCRPSRNIPFIVPVFTQNDLAMFIETNFTEDKMEIQTGLLKCEEQLELDIYPGVPRSFQFRVVNSGHLWVPEYDMEYDLESYCLETFVQDVDDEQSEKILGGAVCFLKTDIPKTFDPNKIPVRKCCLHDEVYSSDENRCISRNNITSTAWTVPLKPSESNSTLLMASIDHSVFIETHELVPSFQTCGGDERGEVVTVAEGQFHVFLDSGYLWVPSINRAVPPQSYCLEDFFTGDTPVESAYVCMNEEEVSKLEFLRQPGCQQEHCVKKCCPSGSIISSTTNACVVAHNYAVSSIKYFDSNETILGEDAEFDVGFPTCESKTHFLTTPEEKTELLKSGLLRYISLNNDECQPEKVYLVPKEEYCVDQVLYPNGMVKDGAVMCFTEHWEYLGISQTDKKMEVNYVYSAFLAISDFFIFISFIVYLTVPDQGQRGLNKNVKLSHSILGRILLRFLFSLFFAYLFLIIIKTASDPINVTSPTACIAMGVGTYVFFMASFFWLNILCFELWWKCSRQERPSGRRWIWYQLYAWVLPLLFGGVALIMELTPSISNCYIKPKFGIYSCFFSYSHTYNDGAKWAYFFGPVAVLLFADLVFFFMTVRSILLTVKQSPRGSVQRKARQRLKLCFKLFLVMGISWMAEIVAFQLGPSTVWYISDVINCFQGFIIFLIFILKPKILDALKSRLCGCCYDAPANKPRGTITFTSFMLSDTQMETTDVQSVSNSTSSVNIDTVRKRSQFSQAASDTLKNTNNKFLHPEHALVLTPSTLSSNILPNNPNNLSHCKSAKCDKEADLSSAFVKSIPSLSSLKHPPLSASDSSMSTSSASSDGTSISTSSSNVSSSRVSRSNSEESISDSEL